MPFNFDDKTFDTLSESMDEIFPEIIEVFFQETESSIQQMETEIAGNNVDEIRGIAHKLKSSAKTFGASGLVAILENIENLKISNNHGDAEFIAAHQSLLDEYSLVKEHILAK